MKDDRKDKLISNIYKAKIDVEILAVSGPEAPTQASLSREQRKAFLAKTDAEIPVFSLIKDQRRRDNELFWCARCERLLTMQQSR